MNTRSSGALVCMAILLFSCSKTNSCVATGENLFENLEKVKEMVSQSGLPTTDQEAAFIVGAARAVSQLEKTPVEICLRSKNSGETEFQVVSTSGLVLEGWRTVDSL